MNSNFNQKWGGQAYCCQLFALCKEEHLKYFGERPNKSQFDDDANYKIRFNDEPLFNPYDLTKISYNDYIMLLARYTFINYYFFVALKHY